MPTGDLEEALGEARRAAKDLAAATARLTKRVLAHADRAAKAPSASLQKAAHRVAEELESMSKEIDRLLKKS